jgi:HEAT repeat protein
MTRKLRVVLVGAWIFLLMGHAFGVTPWGETIPELLKAYSKARSESERVSVMEALRKTQPTTKDDANQLKVVLTQKEWDETLFYAAMESLSLITDTKLDVVLIEIIRADRDFLSKAFKGDLQGRTEQEFKLRSLNAEKIIKKLGDMKSSKAVKDLKEYLAIQGLQYAASEALSKLGDTTAMEEVKNQAYTGADINYAGAGLEEAVTVINDLQDKTKSADWQKMAKQLILIKDPGAKPYLQTLFTHEKNYVRSQAATAFMNMATSEDVSALLDMAKSSDWSVRSAAIHGMKKISNSSLDDALKDMVINDAHRSPRANAAKALGYKKVDSAVSVLEKSLNDKELRVRKEAFVALYILTGKKYDFDGRNALIESEAERQKQHPTFY